LLMNRHVNDLHKQAVISGEQLLFINPEL